MNACHIESWWGGIVVPVDVPGEGDGGHIHICSGWRRTVRLVNDRICELEVGVQRKDGMDILKQIRLTVKFVIKMSELGRCVLLR